MQISAAGTTPLKQHEQPEQANARPRATLAEPVESPRHLVWLLLRDPARLSRAEQHMLTIIRQEPTVELAYLLAQHFIQMMQEHQCHLSKCLGLPLIKCVCLLMDSSSMCPRYLCKFQHKRVPGNLFSVNANSFHHDGKKPST